VSTFLILFWYCYGYNSNLFDDIKGSVENLQWWTGGKNARLLKVTDDDKKGMPDENIERPSKYSQKSMLE
jgi:hypothetical protein